MGHCNEHDTKLLQEFIAFGIFEEIKPDLVPDHAGTVLVACGDGEHTDDWFPHHIKTWPGRKRHHLLLLNGGPALIPKGSPLAEHGEGEVLLNHIVKAKVLKGVKTNVLLGHWPCGAADLADIGLEEYLLLCLQAKREVRKFVNDDSKTLLFLHIAYQGKKRTYRVNREKLEQHLQRTKSNVA